MQDPKSLKSLPEQLVHMDHTWQTWLFDVGMAVLGSLVLVACLCLCLGALQLLVQVCCRADAHSAGDGGFVEAVAEKGFTPLSIKYIVRVL